MKKHRLSLRYKVLLLLTSLPLLTLSLYLVLAMNIFEKDKIAYVFESSSRVSGTMASQIKTQMNGVLSTSRPIFQDYLSFYKFSQTGKSIFEGEFSLQTIVVLSKKDSPEFKMVDFLEKTPNLAKQTIESLGNKYSIYLQEMTKANRLLKAPFSDDRTVLFEKVVDPKTNQETIFVVVINMSDVSEMFKTSASQKLYFVGGDGDILFGPEGTVGQRLQEYFNPSFLAGGDKKITQGAEGIRDQAGRDLLMSFSGTGFGDTYVVSTVDKAQALGATKSLLQKSIIFFVILISVTVIVSLFASSGLTQAITQLFQATNKVAQGDFNIRVDVKSNDEVGALAENFNIMAEEVARLLSQTAEKARMESELQTAKTVQETLFPETSAKIGPLSITGYYEPASECGGDWWHYCQTGQKIFLWIGDATGHGAPAALITSAAKSASTIIERLNISPAKALELLNRSIYDVSKGRIMMTFFLAAFDLETGELTYSNASHEAPFLMRSTVTDLKKKDLVALNEVNNPRLGQDRDTKYNQTTINLDKNDIVFFYTDGIPDIQDLDKNAWGERAFIKALIAANKDFPSTEDSVERFVSMFREHRQGADLIDDVTFFVVKNDA